MRNRNLQSCDLLLPPTSPSPTPEKEIRNGKQNKTKNEAVMCEMEVWCKPTPIPSMQTKSLQCGLRETLPPQTEVAFQNMVLVEMSPFFRPGGSEVLPLPGKAVIISSSTRCACRLGHAGVRCLSQDKRPNTSRIG